MPDKGLYMPSEIPSVSKEETASMKDLAYSYIAFVVTNKFLEGEIAEKDLKRITNESYDYSVPLEHVAENCYLIQLDGGSTASFKDLQRGRWPG